MIRKRWNIIFAIGFISALALFVVLYPETVEYDLEVAGRILPNEELYVSRSMDGIISAVVTDNISGLEKSTFITELERGDIIGLVYNPDIHTGFMVASGDTICWIQSQQSEDDLTALRNELAVEQAALAMSRAGQKKSVIEESAEELAAAKEQLNEHCQILNRQKQLLERGLIPPQVYEQSLSQMTLYEIAVRQAESNLETVRTGSIPQEIAYITARIDGIQSAMDALAEKISRFHIIAPFSGTVLDPGSETNVVTIGSISKLCVIIPIKLKNIGYVHEGQYIKYFVEGIPNPLHGKIVNVGNVTSITRDVQTVIATASIDISNYSLPVATIVRCQIQLEPVTLLEYVFRSVNTVFNR